MSKSRRHVVYVLAASEDGSDLLVVAEGGLPRTEIAVAPGARLMDALRDALRREWGLAGPFLEVYHADAGRPRADGTVATLATLEVPTGWSPSRGAHWSPVDAGRPAVAPVLQARTDELLAEWRGDRPRAALRPPWARPGWYRRASEWITGRLIEAGRPPNGPIEQSAHWELSAVMRADSEGGRAWFKAVFPLFAHEPAVTELLSRELPGHVAPVIAVDQQSGWLLLDDVGSDVIADHPGADDATIRRLVDCQRRFVGREEELRAVGCPHRPFRRLADDLAVAVADPVVRPWIEVADARLDALVAWTDASAGEVDELGFPDTLVHGDFHPQNAALTAEGPVIFDWSDASIANPLVDAMTWSGWLSDEPGRGERAWLTFFDAWADVCPRERAEAKRDRLRGLAAAYHTVSYVGILRELEPLCRADLATGLQQYFTFLDQVVPVSSST